MNLHHKIKYDRQNLRKGINRLNFPLFAEKKSIYMQLYFTNLVVTDRE